jgi:hypothetical protein
LREKKVESQIIDVRHTRLDLAPRGIEKVLRLFPHYFHLEEEMEKAVNVIRGIIQV